MKKAIILTSLILSGCATADMQRADGPDQVFVTAKTPEQVRDCMVARAPHVLTSSAYGDGWIVARSDNKNYAQWVEIAKEGQGAKASLYGSRGMRLTAERCI